MQRDKPFSDYDRLVELPISDKILIRTLYSPQLATGASRHQVMDLVRTVIGELTRPLRWLGRQVSRGAEAANSAAK